MTEQNFGLPRHIGEFLRSKNSPPRNDKRIFAFPRRILICQNLNTDITKASSDFWMTVPKTSFTFTLPSYKPPNIFLETRIWPLLFQKVKEK